MRTTVISICEQTHPCPRGYACDDHIDAHCYSVILSPELENEICEEIQRIEKEAEEVQEKLVEVWFANNPDEKECSYEGEEFVGSVWAEMTAITEVSNPPSHYDTTSETILEILKQVKP
ncbi:MAG: hypothetical protein JRD89_01980 [Deltaproteobacteria bacterium]|nr:hypothetical protein [Deltaproteobacteria bacterium]